MKFAPVVIPRHRLLVAGVLVKRYKRFLADVEVPGHGVVCAHCVNTGAMEGLIRTGGRVWLSEVPPESDRKLRWTWELAELADGTMVGVNTAVPNHVVGQLLRERLLAPHKRHTALTPEKRYGFDGKRRIDFHVAGPGAAEAWIEVKNCHLVYPDGWAYFPDCVSERAAAHLHELAALADGTMPAAVNGVGAGAGLDGRSAHVVFFCQWPGARGVRPSDIHDPAFATAARDAGARGVKFTALAVRQTPDVTVVEAILPVDLVPYDPAPAAGWRAANQALRKLGEA